MKTTQTPPEPQADERAERGLPREAIRKLVELTKTEYWPAIQQFNRFVAAELLNSLLAIDPFKEPAATARTQGMHAGVNYLENEVNREIQRIVEEKGEY